ncbi:lytic transglycosylase domain-containing protein [Bradyrhizobium diazoefficiens]|uniref:lytic transglycosylase domain-containing protein n=1 Tax=Bradyrhizobium diazoefficiens TaxID=1355477 RepID=UPI00190B8222|nr:lytic transglycosylase domain-containing protein [Bradyrhizobium diazoefficiens]
MGRRHATLPGRSTNTAACWRSVGTGICVVVVWFLALTVGDAAASAATRSAEHMAGFRTHDRFAEFIDEASRRFGVPAYWIRAVLELESAGGVRAKSPKGAMGLMQIMPETWAELRLRYGLGNDPYDPHDNILAGSGYLRELHDRYGSPGFLAAYNAGPARYEEHLAGRPLPIETLAYLDKLAPRIGGDMSVSRAIANLRPSAATLFAVLSETSENFASSPPRRVPDRGPIAVFGHAISAIAPTAMGLFVTRSDAEVRR